MANPTKTLRLSVVAAASIITETINDRGIQSASLVNPLQLLFSTQTVISLTPDCATTAGAMLCMVAISRRGA